METAIKGIAEIKDKVDTLIVIPNQKLFEHIDENISFIEAMRKVDDVLAMAVKSISQLINQTGTINVDFADIKSIMSNAGTALMGMGSASGDNRAEIAVKQAINSPMLELSIDGAKGVLFNIVSGKDLSMSELKTISNLITDSVSEDANIYFGANIDEELKDEIRIIVLATAFDELPIKYETPIQKNAGVKVSLKSGSAYSMDDEDEKPTSSRRPSYVEADDDDDDDDSSNKWEELENKPAFTRKKY
jgi:cell division protein FtsZ